jgi:hypothetical protein
MILLLICLILLIPTAIELWDDRNGDNHKDYRDIIIRAIASYVVATVCAVFFKREGFFIDSLIYLYLSIGLFAFFFPPLMNIVHGKKKWWSALSDKAWPDNADWYKNIPWYARWFMHAVLLASAITIYLNPSALISYS